jgi:hypothetical protein
MNRNIPNRPHPTPDPEKPHGASRPDRGSLARTIHDYPDATGHLESHRADAEEDETAYDSCHDDLDMVLSESIEKPDPDPNLEPASERSRQQGGADSPIGIPTNPSGKAPRTSEIFRSVVLPGGDSPTSTPSPSPAGMPDEPVLETGMSGLDVLDRDTRSAGSSSGDDPHLEGHFPWGQIVLLSYASVLTLAMIWLLWPGRVPKAATPEPRAAEKTVEEAPEPTHRPAPDNPPPPLPPENIATLNQSVQIGDLQVKPLSVEAGYVDLVRTIDSRSRRREKDCLILRLELKNLSKDHTIQPLDRNLVRERELRAFDPYIATSDGRDIRLFPLAMDSEWSIRGQDFPTLRPGQSARTFIASEPGSAIDLPDEMTWRIRIRIGVYRSDMLGVKFTRADVRGRRAGS